MSVLYQECVFRLEFLAGFKCVWDILIRIAVDFRSWKVFGVLFKQYWTGLSYINAQQSQLIDLDWDSIVWTPTISTNRNSLMRFELSCPDDGDAFLAIYTTNSLGVIATKLAGYCGNATLVNGTQAFQAQTVCLPAGNYALSMVAYSNKRLPLYIRNVEVTNIQCSIQAGLASNQSGNYYQMVFIKMSQKLNNPRLFSWLLDFYSARRL